jgi:hypothetical protein
VPAVPDAPALEGECVVCGAASPDLICEVCRGIIRGETLERKRSEEHAGHVVTASE